MASATQAVFGKWMALQLTLDNHADRSSAQEKARQLYEQTVQMATSTSKTYDADDLAQLFYAAFESMNTDVEDGSPEQVAALIISVRNAAARGDYGPAMRAMQGTGRNAQLRSRNVVEDRVDGDESEPNAGTSSASGADMMDVEPRAPRAPPAVDADGFTSVVRKGRR